MKGKRKYRCGSCGSEQFIHWRELNRRSRPRCIRCGSYNLEPVTEEAKKERDIGYLNILEYNENRGDIVKRKS